MSRSKAFLGGVFFAYLYQGFVLLAGLWLTPFYLRTLGPRDYGFWLVGLQVLTFLLLADLGVIGVVPRDIARQHGRELSEGNSAGLAVLMGQTAKVVLIQTGLIGLMALALFLFRVRSYPALTGPVGLVLLVFVVTYPLRIFPAVLSGLQDLNFLGKTRTWLWAVSTALTVALLFWGARFYALACGWCLQEIGFNLLGLWRLRRIRSDLVNTTVWNTSGRFSWRWFKRGFWVSVSQLSMWLVGGADLLIVAHSLGAVAVVVYNCTAKLFMVLQNQPQILAGIALPGLSQMRVSESRERTRNATICLTQAMLLIGGAVFCIGLSLNQPLVNLWVGSRFFGGVMLTALIGVNFLVRLTDYTLALALFAFGYERASAIRFLLDGVVSVSVASILVGRMGLAGVMIGFLCGAVLVAIPTDTYLLARELKVSRWNIARPYLLCLWPTVVVGLAGLITLRNIDGSSLLAVAIAGVAICLAYLMLVIPYVRRSELGNYIRPAFIGIRSAVRSRMLAWSGNA